MEVRESCNVRGESSIGHGRGGCIGKYTSDSQTRSSCRFLINWSEHLFTWDYIHTSEVAPVPIATTTY